MGYMKIVFNGLHENYANSGVFHNNEYFHIIEIYFFVNIISKLESILCLSHVHNVHITITFLNNFLFYLI